MKKKTENRNVAAWRLRRRLVVLLLQCFALLVATVAVPYSLYLFYFVSEGTDELLRAGFTAVYFQVLIMGMDFRKDEDSDD